MNTPHFRYFTFFAMFAILLFVSGCEKYDTYSKCTVVEEQNGASVGTAIRYCSRLVDSGDIRCDVRICETLRDIRQAN